MLPVGFLVFSDELAPYRILDVDDYLTGSTASKNQEMLLRWELSLMCSRPYHRV